MGASLYSTSATVEAIMVSLDDFLSFASDSVQPDTTRVLTTRGMLRVMEDEATILRLLANRKTA